MIRLTTIGCIAAILVVTAALPCDDAKRNLIRSGRYNPTIKPMKCIDPCDKAGYEFVNETECIQQRFCHWNGTECSMKTVRNRHRTNPHTTINALLDDLDGRVEGRNLNLFENGGTNPFGGCPKFPENCNIDPFDPNLVELLEPPVNIPYCKRVPCTTSNPALEADHMACISVPGCYYDAELAIIRRYYGHSILPGVPVCHLAIRNKVFQRKAGEYQLQNSNRWNALWSSCLLQQNSDAIYTPSPGCYMLDLLHYMGVKAKRAGWTGITSEECFLIDGCFIPTHGCLHPVQVNRIKIRSEVDIYRSAVPTGRDIYGQPECIPFVNNADASDYLENYHYCLQSGCVADTSVTNSLSYHLYNITMSYVPEHLRRQFWQLVVTNVVTADNWKVEADKLIGNQQNFINNLHQLSGSNYVNLDPNTIASLLASTGLSSGNIQTVPFALPINNNNNLQQLIPYLNPNQIPGLNIPQVSPSFSGNFGPLYTPYLPQEPACPYHEPDLYGFVPLKGPFTDCCKRNLCYEPLPTVLNQYSGVANYWAPWEYWGPCSTTCGGGTKERKRRCVAHKEGGSCDGIETQQMTCNVERCPEWLPWDDWEECTTSCGGGIEIRKRSCDSVGCSGLNEESRYCNTIACPVFQQWSQWSDCSQTCGDGSSVRVRTCDDSNTTLSCPYAGSTELMEEKDCTSYCGVSVQTSRSSCVGFPACAITTTYKCDYTDLDGQTSTGNCRNFKSMRKTRCLGDLRCRFCNFFLGYCEPV